MIDLAEAKLAQSSPSDTLDFLDSLKERILVSNPNLTYYIKPEILDLGQILKHGKVYRKQAFVVNLQKIIQIHLEILPHAFTKINGKFVIKLALYFDEISLTNPIGNFI